MQSYFLLGERMKPMACLILFGCIGVILLQVFRPKQTWKVSTILLLSLAFLFYCSSSLAAMSLMLAWVLSSYFFAQWVGKNPNLANVRGLYVLGVVSVFCAFKLGLFPSSEKGSLMENAMPIGFSFMMFHSIALLLDQRGSLAPKPAGLREYATSALFFPTYAIGPFHKFQVFQKGLDNGWSANRLFHGYCLICLGALKLGISGILLKPFFLRGMPLVYVPDKNPFHPFVFLLLASTFLFANFSGYSDLVVGFAKMMGFEIPPNFRFPFLARSMSEYWRSWHISLGAWFKEYVFLPLHYKLASQRTIPWSASASAAIAVFITFFLIGIWHEFSLKILIYSLVNGALVAFFFPNNRNPWIGIPLTFIWALLINGLFLSRDLGTFATLMTHMPLLPVPEEYHINLMTVALVVSTLAIFYGAERLVDALALSSSRWGGWIFGANFGLCIIELFIGITLGIGRTDAVYIGY